METGEEMLTVEFRRREGASFRLLCLGAHSDDIEIGCGGTVLRLLEERPDSEVHWVVLGATGERAAEARRAADRFLARARSREVVIRGFRDGYFPSLLGEVKDFFEDLKGRCSPDLILTHCRNDLHQDHRVVSELTWNTFRDHLILEYEIAKYDGDLGAPNAFVHVSEAAGREKVRHILECFQSQRQKAGFTEDVFLAMLRLRGVESNATERYAEGYYCRKIDY
jgi:LmbE family N-acetylglucosaminyl deacetylase